MCIRRTLSKVGILSSSNSFKESIFKKTMWISATNRSSTSSQKTATSLERLSPGYLNSIGQFEIITIKIYNVSTSFIAPVLYPSRSSVTKVNPASLQILASSCLRDQAVSISSFPTSILATFS